MDFDYFLKKSYEAKDWKEYTMFYFLFPLAAGTLLGVGHALAYSILSVDFVRKIRKWIFGV